MDKYHFRRPEKMIFEKPQLLEIIKGQKYMTLAMCNNNEPYLTTLSYAYDETQNCFYFHCAQEGKKIKYLTSNPIVWGQILEDLGYQNGECNHAYRTVQFKGRTVKVTDKAEKFYAINLLIDQLEKDPEPVKKRLTSKDAISGTAIIRIEVEGMSGKDSQKTSKS